MTLPRQVHFRCACALVVALALAWAPRAVARSATHTHAKPARPKYLRDPRATCLPGDATELLRSRHGPISRRTGVLVPVALLTGLRSDCDALLRASDAAQASGGVARSTGWPAPVPRSAAAARGCALRSRCAGSGHRNHGCRSTDGDRLFLGDRADGRERSGGRWRRLARIQLDDGAALLRRQRRAARRTRRG